MNTFRWLIASLALFFSLSLSGCGHVPYTMDAPEAFKRFDDNRNFTLITADGVMLRARQVENYPRADLQFWKDAMTRHMEEQGYVLGGTESFATRHALQGCTLTFLLPRGAEDWVLAETIFVVNKTIVLVEVTGEYTQYQAVEASLKSALKTFSPNL